MDEDELVASEPILIGDMSAYLNKIAMETSAVGSFAWHTDCDLVDFSETQTRLTGLTPVNGRVPVSDFFERVVEEDLPALQAAIDRARNGKTSYTAEFRFNRPDGKQIWIGGRGNFKQVRGHDNVTLFGTNFDVTRLKEAEFAARDLAAEMAHRVGNLLTLVSGMARMTLRQSQTAQEYHDALISRIDAIDVVTKLAMGRHEGRMTLGNIAERTLLPYCESNQITINVSDDPISDLKAQTVSLALNELATNAVKYGALQDRDGSVTLFSETNASTGELTLSWIESRPAGIIIPDQAQQKGFGSNVLDRMMRSSGATPIFDWTQNGLCYRASWPRGSLSL